MADNNNVIWKETDRAGGNIIDEFNQDEVNEKRSQVLTLEKINRNGTISEMMDTIDANFRELAQHGGGPSGIDGVDGTNGEDGVNVEYIYILCDEMTEDKYPTNDSDKSSLFNTLSGHEVQSTTYNGYTWYDRAQPISEENKNEYVLSRFRRESNSTWYYAEKPELWAHWGETGKDGDGVEYIFMTSNEELTSEQLESKLIKRADMSTLQKLVYDMDDFYPGEKWFEDNNKKKVIKDEIKKRGLNISDTEVDDGWANKFGMIKSNTNWTDDPSGVGPEALYEYVAIRRSKQDQNGKKIWGDYSTPVLWSNYTFEGRISIVYCNAKIGTTPQKPEDGQGHYDIANKLVTGIPDITLEDGTVIRWTNNNVNKTDEQATWMCTGIFTHDGDNVSWSNPVCITGKDGKNGEDGTTVQFIYAVSIKPNYPNTYAEKESLFDAVENDTEHNPKYSEYNGTRWYDRAQPITLEARTEYMWSRRREKETDEWTYDSDPIIWAHWGEDGTDGDGVEYIFTTTSAENPSSLKLPKVANMDDDQKKVFQIDDFIPSRDWFARPASKTKVQKILGDEFDETKWNNNYGFHLPTDWRDEPIPVDPLTPYQWVSIRRSRADEISGKRLWEDFSDPVLWNSYGKSTRVFIIYCNMPIDEEHPDNEKPNKPVDGTGVWVNTQNRNYLDLNGVVDALTDVTDEQKALKIGIWNDKNTDVRDTISWMCSGIFTDDGSNVSWSQPFRISGAKGEPGVDGDDMQYVYCLSDTRPSFPKPGTNMSDSEYDRICAFFDNIENAQNANIYDPSDPVNEGLDIENIHRDANGVLYYEYTDENGTTSWYDSPQSVDEMAGKRTEWVWLRTKSFDKPRWEFVPEPTIWSHWGEDGTDGDGVEYIFHLSAYEQCPTLELPPVEPTGSTLKDRFKKAIYNIREFYPDKRWFLADTNGDGKIDGKEDARIAIVDSGIASEGEFERMWNDEVSSNRFFGFNCGWLDDPQETDFFLPFQFVSIRKSYTDENGNKKWGPYSTPKIWSRYLMQTRVFILYCNIPITENQDERTDGDIIVPTAPDLDYGWWAGDDRLYGAQPEEGVDNVPYQADAFNSEDTSVKVGTWSDADEDEENTITWICSITFAENGKAVSCSEPFRITGARGYRGVDGADIEFIYARCLDDDLKYPKPENSSYEQIMAFFDSVENSTNVEDGRKYVDYQGCRWYDNPIGVAAESTKVKEWVWQRSKPRGTTLNPSPNWVYPPKPVIWSHWGEDGTDGDGVEYIFMMSQTNTYGPTLETWNSYWNAFTTDATAKAIYSMNDFIPKTAWFTDEIKASVQTKMHDEELGTFNESTWNALKSKNWSALGTWTDNPGDVSPAVKYQFVAIRRADAGVYGPFSYPTIWSTYSTEKFTTFSFTATETNVDLSDITPSGGSFSNPFPNDVTVGGKTYTWSDGPQPDVNNGKIIIWMTSAVVQEGKSISGWSKPQKMIDEDGFQIEWCASEITTAQKQSLESNVYCFETYMKNAQYNESAAEVAWRNAVSSNLGLTFNDDSTDAIYMATAYVKNSVWTNWRVVKVRGEDGDSVSRKYAQYDNSWGQFKDIVSINATGTTVTFKSADNATHTKATTNSPLGADENHCVEVMSERISNDGTGDWSFPVISSKYFNQDEIGDMVNASLVDSNDELVDFVERHAGEQINEALGPYATTDAVNTKLEDYVTSSAFTIYQSDASKKFAQAETIAANTTFAQDSDGYLIYKSNGTSSPYKTLEDYYNSLSAAEKAALDTDGTGKGLDDPTVVENLLNKMKSVFRMTYTEIATVKQTVDGKTSMTEVINAVNASDSLLYGAIRTTVSDKASQTDLTNAITTLSSSVSAQITQAVSDKASKTELSNAITTLSSSVTAQITQAVSDKASKTELSNAITTLSSSVTAQITQAVSDKASKTELSNAITTLSSSVTAQITQAVSDKASKTELSNAISTLSSTLTAKITQAVSDKASMTEIINAVSDHNSSLYGAIRQQVSDKASMTEIINAVNDSNSDIHGAIRQQVSDKVSQTELTNAITTLSSSVSAQITQAVSDKASKTELSNAITTLSNSVSAQITQAVSDKASITQLNNAISSLSNTLTAKITQAVSDKVSMTDIINEINTGSSTIKAAITAYANKSESGIRLAADRIDLSAAHQLNLTGGTFTINTENLKLNGNGLELRSKNGATTIDSNGVLHASGAEISGTVTANEFMATSGDRTTTITGDTFNISHSGGNSVYISIEDSVSNGGTTFTNVPTLCMTYNGEKYILNPVNWILQSGADTSAMGFYTNYDMILQPYYTYSYTDSQLSSHNIYKGTFGIYTYYWFANISDYVSQNATTQKLFRFKVKNLGKNTTTSIGYITSNELASSSATDMTTINSTGAYTWGSGAAGYSSITTPITSANCSDMKNLLTNTWTYSGYYLGLHITHGQECRRTTDVSTATLSNTYGLKKLYNFILHFAGLDGYDANGTSYYVDSRGWHVGSKGVYTNYDFSQILPFEFSGTDPYEDGDDCWVNVIINAYPIISMLNKGKTLNAVNKIWTTVQVNLWFEGLKSNSVEFTEVDYSYGTPQGTPVTQYVSDLYLTVDFNLVLDLSTAISATDVSSLKTSVLNAIDYFLQNLQNLKIPDSMGYALIDSMSISGEMYCYNTSTYTLEKFYKYL